MHWQRLPSTLSFASNPIKRGIDFRLLFDSRVCMLYFAFGSNMNSAHLTAWLQEFGVQDEPLLISSATLLDHRLRSNYLASRGLGAANIECAEWWRVEGLLYRITPAIQEGLRAKEGWPGRYGEISVLVTVPGRLRRTRAITYQVTQECSLPRDIPVSSGYRQLILDGAKEGGLTLEYQDWLRRFLVTPEMLLRRAFACRPMETDRFSCDHELAQLTQ